MREGNRVAIVLEGRDAAGKGSTASGITHYLNPKSATIVSQGIPTPKEMRNWLGTHYNLLPDAGQITVFDRSWYSRALIQPVLGFCSMRQYGYFMNRVNDWERSIIDEGSHLFSKSICRYRGKRRIPALQNAPRQRAAVLEILVDRPQGGRALASCLTYFKERMFAVTSTDYAPWVTIDSDNKHQARLNVIHYILSRFDYEDKDLSLESLQAEIDSQKPTDVIVDGVLFKDMDAEQIQVLERVLMNE